MKLGGIIMTKPNLEDLKEGMKIEFTRPSRDITVGKHYQLFKETSRNGYTYLKIRDDVTDKQVIARIGVPNGAHDIEYIALGDDMDFKIVDEPTSKPNWNELKAGQYIVFKEDAIGIKKDVPYLLRESTNGYGKKVLRIHDSNGSKRGIAVMEGEDTGYVKLGAQKDFTVRKERFVQTNQDIFISVNKLQEAMENKDITNILELKAYLKGFTEGIGGK